MYFWVTIQISDGPYQYSDHHGILKKINNFFSDGDYDPHHGPKLPLMGSNKKHRLTEGFCTKIHEILY